MSRRILIIAAIFLAVTFRAPLTAQTDPFLGVWEINPARSALTRGTMARSEIIAMVAEPGGVKSILVTVSAERGNAEVHHFIFDGKPHATEGSDQREMSAQRTNPRRIDAKIIRNGKETATRSFEVSEDGKTLTVIGNGTTGSGTPYANDTRVYEKK